ncbi:MAG: hypothetical protein ABI425_03405 [Patescibacteria group bacterium]
MTTQDLTTTTTNSIDLVEHHIARPEKVRWIFPQSPDILANMKSKGLRSFLARIEDVFTEQHITWKHLPMTRESFSEWLVYYAQKMQEQDHDVIATLDWFDEKRAEKKDVSGFFFYKNDQPIGSAIQVMATDSVSLAFKASERIELSSRGNSNLGSAIEYIFLKEAIATGKIVSSGTSRNAFGVINNFGYLDFKLRFGYQPEPNMKYDLLNSVPIDEQGVVAFFGLDQNQKGGFYVLHKPTADIKIVTEILQRTSLPVHTIVLP